MRVVLTFGYSLFVWHGQQAPPDEICSRTVRHNIGTREDPNPFTNARLDVIIEADSHVYIPGMTGTGKSTVAKRLFIDKVRYQGGGFIDPHGTSAERILGHIPRHRTKSVVYIDAGDKERPPSINPLWHVPKDQRSFIAGSLVYAFRSLSPDSWGPLLEMILYHSIMSILDIEEGDLFAVLRFLGDASFRAEVIPHTQNKPTKLFWNKTYPGWDKSYRKNAFPSSYNKVDQIINSDEMLNILAQGEPSFSLKHIIENQQIFILNLNQGVLEPRKVNLLGSMILSTVFITAMQQVKEKRKRFYLFVDEFKNLSTESSVDILSEARKYRLFLTLMNQFDSQLPEKVQDAIDGNINTKIIFRVGDEDAEKLAKSFVSDDHLDTQSLMTLGDGEAVIKTMNRDENGRRTYEPPFRALLHPPLLARPERAEKLKQDCRARFHKRKRGQVEREIDKRVGFRPYQKELFG